MACRGWYRHHHRRGQPSGVIGDVMEGPWGTRFHAQASPLENRKRWIFVFFCAPPAGELTVDEGATAAILERGSRYPKKERDRQLSRGEVIRIRNLKVATSSLAKVVITATRCVGLLVTIP